MSKIIELALKYRFLVIILALLAVGIGIYDLRRLPIDAVPDITPNQVLILTRAPGARSRRSRTVHHVPGRNFHERFAGNYRNPLDVTFWSFGCLCVLQGRRGHLLRSPPSSGAVAASKGHDSGRLRQPGDGANLHGLGEIYQFEVNGEGYSPMELRSTLEWDVAFKLRSVPGVVEVNTYGGELKRTKYKSMPAN